MTAHVMTFAVDYAKHMSVSPGHVCHVTLRLPGLPPDTYPAIVITHRGGTSDPLWFDFSYSDGSAPMTDMLEPGVDNSFVLMPREHFRIEPGYLVNEVTMTSTGHVDCSVMAMW